MANEKNDPTMADAITALTSFLKDQKAGTAEAITAALKAARTDGAGLSPATLDRLESTPAAKRWREVECVSVDTGATFTAHVVESKTHKNGRITEMKNYRLPAGAATYQSEGGLVPDGQQIMMAGAGAPLGDPNLLPRRDLTQHYLHWRWTEFFQKDSRSHVGRELVSYMAANPAAFSKPWNEGKYRMSVEDDAA